MVMRVIIVNINLSEEQDIIVKIQNVRMIMTFVKNVILK